MKRASDRKRIEDLLRRSRPEAPDQLVDALARRTSSRAPRLLSLRSALRTVVLTAALLGAVGAVGGVGYAMTFATDAIVKLTSHRTYTTHQTIQTVNGIAADDQYGTTTTTTTTTATTTTPTTSTTTTTTATTTTLPAGSQTVTVAPPPPNSTAPVVIPAVTLPPPLPTSGGGTPAPAVTASVSIPAAVAAAITAATGAGTVPASVVVSPATAPAQSTFGASSSAISVTVTDSTGAVIHAFATPLAITFSNVPTDFTPTTSDNGSTWRAIPVCVAPQPTTLATDTDCYTRIPTTSTTITIYTNHLSLFAVQQQVTAFTPLAIQSSAVLQPPHNVLVVTLKTTATSHVDLTLRYGATTLKSWHRWLLTSGSHTLKLSVLGLTLPSSGLTLGVVGTGESATIRQTIKIPATATAKPATKAKAKTKTTKPAAPSPKKHATVAPPAPAVGQKVSLGPLKATVSKQLPVEANGVAATATASQVFVVGGHGSYQVLAGTSAASLHRIASLPERLTSAITIAIPARQAVYVIGGERGTTPSSRMFRIDLSTHKVTEVGAFVEPLAESAVVQESNAAYIIGGWTGHKYATAILYFTAPDQVVLVSRLPVGLRAPATALLDGKIYIAGGRSKHGTTRTIYVFDPSTRTVKRLGTLPQAVSNATLVASGSQLYLLGGKTAKGKQLASVVRINPTTGRATTVGQMPRPLADAAAVPFGNEVLIVDGAGKTVYRLKRS